MKYSDAGVDIDRGDEVVRRIKKHVRTTFDANVLTDIGSFGGLYALTGYKNPVLVAGTDGVGTKLKIAFLTDKHDTVGIDLVAMSVNDVLVQGARPLFFLDYVASGLLKPEVIETIVAGIAEGCRQSGCALLGGETAEMPGFYAENEYDLAGFAVGACERDKVITGEKTKIGDVVIGIASTGVHSNGYSLARKALIDEKSPDKDMLNLLLTPTKIYVKPVLDVLSKVDVHAMVHITGGGFYDNIPRVLNNDQDVYVKKGTWEILPVFQKIMEKGPVEEREMFRTFNMGIGYMIIVDPKDADAVLAVLKEHGEKASVIGDVRKGEQKVVIE